MNKVDIMIVVITISFILWFGNIVYIDNYNAIELRNRCDGYEYTMSFGEYGCNSIQCFGNYVCKENEKPLGTCGCGDLSCTCGCWFNCVEVGDKE